MRFAWFHASTEMYIRLALFWSITQRIVPIHYRGFGTTYRSHLHGSRVNHYHYTLRNVPEERWSRECVYPRCFFVAVFMFLHGSVCFLDSWKHVEAILTVSLHMSDGTALLISPTRIENPKRKILEKSFLIHGLQLFHILNFSLTKICRCQYVVRATYRLQRKT